MILQPARVLTVAVLVTALALSACSGDDGRTSGGSEASGASAASPSSKQTETPSDGASDGQSGEQTDGTADGGDDAPPLPRIGAGAVADGRPATVRGRGPAVVRYRPDSETAFIARLDCSACRGKVVVVTDSLDGKRWVYRAPFTGEFLVHMFGHDKPVVTVEASGRWTLTLSSWNDQEPSSGAQRGEGPAVLFLADRAAGVTFGYQPHPQLAEDEFHGRIITNRRQNPTVFGDTEPFQDRFIDTPVPGVIAIRTAGSWELRPGR